MLELTKENYQQTVQESEIVIIDFWAQWCAPCQQFAPIFEKLSNQYPQITFAKLNTDVELVLSNLFSVKNLPTTMVVKNKKVLFKRVGLLSETDLTELIENALIAS